MAPTYTSHYGGPLSLQTLHPAAVLQPLSRPIYSHIRDCTGIIGSSTSPSSSTTSSLMGTRADEYFSAHGYRPGTVRLIQKVYEEASDMNAFTDKLSRQEIPITEARYMYTLISDD